MPQPSTGIRLLSSPLKMIFLPLSTSFNLDDRHWSSDWLKICPNSLQLIPQEARFNCVAMLFINIMVSMFINVAQHAQYIQQQVYVKANCQCCMSLL